MYYYDSSQHIFDRALWAIITVGRWLVQAIVYLPLWFCGYLISTTFLQKNDSVWAWLATTIIFALVIYQLLFFAKGLVVGLRNQKNGWWIVLFIGCFVFACAVPAVMFYYVIKPIVNDWAIGQSSMVATMISIAFGGWVYTRYHFLSNFAPQIAFAAYQFGLDCSRHWFGLADHIPAKKSSRWI